MDEEIRDVIDKLKENIEMLKGEMIRLRLEYDVHQHDSEGYPVS
jgi:hypothetical protein